MPDRSYAKNLGFLSLPEIPEDRYIVGAVIVMIDDAGEYSSQLVPVDLDAVPEPDTQKVVGGYVAQAFEIANLTGLTS